MAKPENREDIMEKYNFENVYDFPGKEAENVSQMFDEVTYTHGIDFEINISAPIEFERSDILTFGHGKCHKIQPVQEIAATQHVYLEFAWKEDSEPKTMVLYLFSNNRFGQPSMILVHKLATRCFSFAMS